MGQVPIVDKSLQDTNKSIQTAQQCLVSVNDVGSIGRQLSEE